MADNTVFISGMVGARNTYFAGNPVVVRVSNLLFPESSPIKVVRVKVLNGDGTDIAGEFTGEVAGASPYSIRFDISSALRSMWALENFASEVAKAQAVLGDSSDSSDDEEYVRAAKAYRLQVFTEYVDSTDGELTTTQCQVRTEGGTAADYIAAGHCVLGGRTEWERYLIDNDRDDDVSSLEKTNPRNGDASTKPRTTPELVGSDSITSWVDLYDTDPTPANHPATRSIFFSAPSSADLPAVTGQSDDPRTVSPWTGHAPLVLRDSVPYVDFLFLNRRGAIETCSGQMLQALDIPVETQQSVRVEAPAYRPTRTVMARATGGRRSWSMSSGYQTREWAEWWATEFLMAGRHWMRVRPSDAPNAPASGMFVPVTVTPAKKNNTIFDRTKQDMPHVDFTVTLALEG